MTARKETTKRAGHAGKPQAGASPSSSKKKLVARKAEGKKRASRNGQSALVKVKGAAIPAKSSSPKTVPEKKQAVKKGNGSSSPGKITKADKKEGKKIVAKAVEKPRIPPAKPRLKSASPVRTKMLKPSAASAKGQSKASAAKVAIKKAAVKVAASKKGDPKKKTLSKALEFPTAKWGTDSVITFEATEHMPPTELTSIAGGFVFYNDRLILANIPGRGWEIIGGRIDIGEPPEETFRREATNQAGVQLSYIQMIGLVRIEHMGPEPPNCPYPFPVSYGVQFIGIATELPKFMGSSDSLGRSLITPDGFREHYFEWNEYYDAVFRYAYEVYQKAKKKLKL